MRRIAAEREAAKPIVAELMGRAAPEWNEEIPENWRTIGFVEELTRAALSSENKGDHQLAYLQLALLVSSRLSTQPYPSVLITKLSEQAQTNIAVLRANGEHLPEDRLADPEAVSQGSGADVLDSTPSQGDRLAKERVTHLRSQPLDQWPFLVESHPEWRSPLFVQELIESVDSLNFSAPADAVVMMHIAVRIADALESTSQAISTLRARAYREYGFALLYTGAYRESLNALDRSDTILRDCTDSDHDRGCALLYRARVFIELERLDDALELTSEAERIFSRIGNQYRIQFSSTLRGWILLSARRFRDAAPIFQSIAEKTDDAKLRACAIHNLAITQRELFDFERAQALFSQAAKQFEELGLTTMHAKARWNLASIFAAQGRHEAALSLLFVLRDDFEEFGMAEDVALISIEIAEALLLLGRPSEVPAVCEAAMRYFRLASLAYTQGALMAFAFLQEAARSMKLTVEDVRRVRAFFEILPKQPHLFFAPLNKY